MIVSNPGEYEVIADTPIGAVLIDVFRTRKDAKEMDAAVEYALGRRPHPVADEAAQCLAAVALVFAGVKTERTGPILRNYLARPKKVH